MNSDAVADERARCLGLRDQVNVVAGVGQRDAGAVKDAAVVGRMAGADVADPEPGARASIGP